jgi:uncharacterized NAD(P)/FAD-binding protein YdhS
MKAATARLSIAVIGAGFSGLMSAIHLLLKSGEDGPRVYLIEQSEAFGLGAAYATDSGRHVLNTRAGNMSVFPDRPEHFLQWLQARDGTYGVTAASFITRRTYGEYLQSLVRDAACGPHAAGRLYLVPDEAVGLHAEPDGSFGVSLKVGKVLNVDAVVIATGNSPPHPPQIPDTAFFDSSHYIDDPWAPGAFSAVKPEDTVVTLGTGLTMVDVALLLKARGHEGPVIAISRRGQIPRPHIAPGGSPGIPLPELPPQLSQAVKAVRQTIRITERQGDAWQHVMDALRPLSSAYWQALPKSCRERFLRHLRPWWDVHRHRLAPQVANRVQKLLTEGMLIVCRGRLVRMTVDAEPDSFPVTVSWRPAGDTTVYKIGTHHVVNCMGPGGDPTRSHSPLIKGLLASGLARPDPLQLGLDVDPQGRLVSLSGETSARLFALGPPTRGVFWESTAVPDIRQHAWRLSDTVLGALDRLPA